MKNDKVNTKIS